MGKLGTWTLTAVIAVVFGFLGAFVAVQVFADQLRGEQGVTGLAGPPGEQGPSGQDGADGAPGARGLPGKAGRAGRAAAPKRTDLGTTGCAGTAVDVVTDVVVKGQRMNLVKKPVCVVR
jgi:hypothetical protein